MSDPMTKPDALDIPGLRRTLHTLLSGRCPSSTRHELEHDLAHHMPQALNELEQARARIRQLTQELTDMRAMRDGFAVAAGDFVGKIEALEARIQQLTIDNEEYTLLFNLQHTRTREADNLWQEATGNRDMLPDLGVLIQWLLDRIKALESQLAAKQEDVDAIIRVIERVEIKIERGDRTVADWLAQILQVLVINRDLAAKQQPCPVSELPACAAIRYGSIIIAGKRHHDCIATGTELGLSKRQDIRETQGFMTTRGRFVNRVDAKLLMDRAGLDSVSRDGYRGDQLYSEDLY